MPKRSRRERSPTPEPVEPDDNDSAAGDAAADSGSDPEDAEFAPPARAVAAQATFPAPLQKCFTALRYVKKRRARGRPGVFLGRGLACFDENKRAGRAYVIKGPYVRQSLEHVRLSVSQKIKAALDLPHANGRIVDLDGKQFFVADFIQGAYDDASTTTDSTSFEAGYLLWTGHRQALVPEVHLEDPHLAVQAMAALLFLRCIGAGDVCYDNFVVHDRRVYTVDDGARFLEQDYMLNRPLKQKLPLFATALKVAWPGLQLRVSSWKADVQKVLCGEQLRFFVDALDGLMRSPENWPWG